jgi:hypothetical protein
MRWRTVIAKVAGMPPLDMMDGFFEPDEWWFMTTLPDVDNPKMYSLVRDEGASFRAYQAIKELPISWDCLKPDPLHVLLHHSDCEGSIPAADCGPIADRLESLLPMLPKEPDAGHIGDWAQKTQTFIDGHRRAAAAGEDVEFK